MEGCRPPPAPLPCLRAEPSRVVLWESRLPLCLIYLSAIYSQPVCLPSACHPGVYQPLSADHLYLSSAHLSYIYHPSTYPSPWLSRAWKEAACELPSTPRRAASSLTVVLRPALSAPSGDRAEKQISTWAWRGPPGGPDMHSC